MESIWILAYFYLIGPREHILIQCTEVGFTCFSSNIFITVAIVNPLDWKLVNCTSVQWVMVTSFMPTTYRIANYDFWSIKLINFYWTNQKLERLFWQQTHEKIKCEFWRWFFVKSVDLLRIVKLVVKFLMKISWHQMWIPRKVAGAT